jgi:hypothetical protein
MSSSQAQHNQVTVSTSSSQPRITLEFNSILVMYVGTGALYRVTDIDMRLGYTSGVSMRKLKSTVHQSWSLLQLIPDPLMRRSAILKSSNLYLTTNVPEWSRLMDASRFVQIEAFRYIVANSTRKSEALVLAPLLQTVVLRTCIQAEVEAIIKRRLLNPWRIEIVGERSMGRYRPDMMFPEFSSILEIDEHGHSDRDPVREQERQAFLESRGNSVVRFNPHANRHMSLEDRCLPLERDLLIDFSSRNRSVPLLRKWHAASAGDTGKLPLPKCLVTSVLQMLECAVLVIAHALIYQGALRRQTV